jgi:hypothetical protein
MQALTARLARAAGWPETSPSTATVVDNHPTPQRKSAPNKSAYAS